MTEPHQPNTEGFAGGATTPEPTADGGNEGPRRQPEAVDGEGIAVPAGDLTGAVSDAISADPDGPRP
jgi:hypothetical protein